MEHRPASLADLDRIMTIVGEAKLFLRESGLPQWQTEYPTQEDFAEDIARSCCHVFTAEDKVAGVISVCFTPENDYRSIEEGAWLTEGEDYAVVHRMAIASEYRSRRLSGEMLSLAEKITRMQACPSIRVDTHGGNKSMRGLLEKHGYVYCGIIYLEGLRTPEMHRVCYEKVL